MTHRLTADELFDLREEHADRLTLAWSESGPDSDEALAILVHALGADPAEEYPEPPLAWVAAVMAKHVRLESLMPREPDYTFED
jgi:hypothetical protein